MTVLQFFLADNFVTVLQCFLADNFVTYQNTTNTKIAELQALIRGLRAKIESLEIQLEMLEKEKQQIEKEKDALIQQKEEEKIALDSKLEEALQSKASDAKKWEENYEKMRTVSIVKEQELLDDFEWKLREIQQTCKKKLMDKDKSIEEKLQDACKEADDKKKEAESILAEVKLVFLIKTWLTILNLQTVLHYK